MPILMLIGIGIAFTLLAALVFSLLTIILDWLDIEAFSIHEDEDFSFWHFYSRYLIVAAVYTFITLPMGGGFIGTGAMALAYKFVFDAGWIQAIVMGVVGGIISLMLFQALLIYVLPLLVQAT